MSVTGEPDGAPVKCGVPLADFARGLYAAFAIAAALAARAHGRHGRAHRRADARLHARRSRRCRPASTSAPAAIRRKLGSAHPRNAPYQAFRRATATSRWRPATTSCGASVCGGRGPPELRRDARFATTAAARDAPGALKEILEARVRASTTADHWLASSARPACRMRADQRLRRRSPTRRCSTWNGCSAIELPNGARDAHLRVAAALQRHAAPEIRRGPPALGEHDEEVLGESAAKA